MKRRKRLIYGLVALIWLVVVIHISFSILAEIAFFVVGFLRAIGLW